MAVFLGVHDMGGAKTEAEMTDAFKRYQEACKKHGAEAHKTYINAEKGRGFCIPEADSAKTVQTAHDEAGVPVNEVIEVHKIK